MKIIKSQSDDTKLAIQQLAESMEDLNTIKTQLELCRDLAEKQAEEIAALTRSKKALQRVRIYSICVAGTGLVLGTVGFFLKNNAETEIVGNSLFYSGISLTGSGAVGIIFTIHF
jgi:hypothetical protein